MGESSRRSDEGLIWQRIWKSKLPNKIKVFGWRLCQDILPTKENFSRRKIVKDSRCSLCKQSSESVLHVLWECGVAQDVWVGNRIYVQKCARAHNDIKQLLKDLIGRLTTEDMDLILVQCWIIWNQRN